MKNVIYAILGVVALFFFLPEQGSTKIRNLPLLIAILCLVAAVIFWRLLRYVFLLTKTKKLLKMKKFKDIRCEFSPFASRLRGRYTVSFQKGDETVQIVLLRRRTKYPHYHFRSGDRIEFYRTTRIAVVGRTNGRISGVTETHLAGKQKIRWNEAATTRVVLFDKLPPKVSDAAKKGEVGVGEHMASVNAYLLDEKAFQKYMDHTK